jgi:hypothetical protein
LPDFLIGIIGADDGEEAVATAEPVISLQTFAFIKYAGIKYFSCFGFRSLCDEIRRSPKDQWCSESHQDRIQVVVWLSVALNDQFPIP